MIPDEGKFYEYPGEDRNLSSKMEMIAVPYDSVLVSSSLVISAQYYEYFFVSVRVFLRTALYHPLCVAVLVRIYGTLVLSGPFKIQLRQA